ncbi:MAG: DUF456 family protein [Bacteroidota bacterium]
MDVILIILAIVLCIIGIVGSVLPALPGHPLNYIAMWCVQWVYHPFSNTVLTVFGILTVVVILFDYLMPVWWAKKYGATRQGIIGSIIGMLSGIFFTPIGMILGTLAGAIIGDMLAGRTGPEAARSGMATLIGTFVAVGVKVLLAGIMTSYIMYELIAKLLS